MFGHTCVRPRAAPACLPPTSASARTSVSPRESLEHATHQGYGQGCGQAMQSLRHRAVDRESGKSHARHSRNRASPRTPAVARRSATEHDPLQELAHTVAREVWERPSRRVTVHRPNQADRSPAAALRRPGRTGKRVEAGRIRSTRLLPHLPLGRCEWSDGRRCPATPSSSSMRGGEAGEKRGQATRTLL